MFCPNCGNNCGEAKFCVKCGTKIQQEAAAPTAWAPGMACPHCGGTKLEGQNCAFCGALLAADDPAAESSEVCDHGLDSYDIPYRKFYPNPFVKHCFSIEKDALAIESGGMFNKQREVIPYQNLTKAEYKLFSDAKVEILFHYRVPNSTSDSKVALLGRRYEFGSDLLYHAFCVIQHLAPASTVFSVEYPPVDENAAALIHSSGINLEAYFERFNPFRVPAANELCHSARISRTQAQGLIDELFFTHQAKLYRADSLLAVRDFNRISAEKDKEIEERDQERRENRRRRNRRR